MSSLLRGNDYFQKEKIADLIQKRVHEIAGAAMETWQEVTMLVGKNRTRVVQHLQAQYTPVIIDKWAQWVLRNKIDTNDFS